MSNQPEILPCPFCGEKHIDFEYYMQEKDSRKIADRMLAWMECFSCETKGPSLYLIQRSIGDARKEAIEKWNKRA